ncbi:MAG: hypothetical protein HZB55_09115 [Deltaproteobacteria bacterium]|nr:hypothetical protein [Deltaproteobacteria bacterium]
MKRLVTFGLVIAAATCRAAPPGLEATDARALGMGGAYRSLAETTAAARFNPAGLSPHRGFFAGASYATSPTSALDAVHITLVDNITSPMGGALQYSHFQGKEEREEISLSLSAGDTKQFSGLWWGFTGRYVQARGRSAAEWDDLLTGDVGFLFERPGGIRIAAVGYDIFDTSSTFLNRRIALGVSRSSPEGWVVAGDVVRNLDRDVSSGVDLHVGGEYARPGSPWAFRAGYQWRGDTGKDYGSLGVGWRLTDVLQLAGALQQARQGADGHLVVVSVEGSF